MQIITNNQYRTILLGYDLPNNVRSDFDYLNEEEFCNASFVKYKGNYYDLGDLMRANIADWDAIHSDSAFSGVLFKLSKDGDSVKCASYFC